MEFVSFMLYLLNIASLLVIAYYAMGAAWLLRHYRRRLGKTNLPGTVFFAMLLLACLHGAFKHVVFGYAPVTVSDLLINVCAAVSMGWLVHWIEAGYKFWLKEGDWIEQGERHRERQRQQRGEALQ